MVVLLSLLLSLEHLLNSGTTQNALQTFGLILRTALEWKIVNLNLKWRKKKKKKDSESLNTCPEDTKLEYDDLGREGSIGS